MRLVEILLHISNVAKAKGLSTPYIVGGLPRDKLLGREKEINDIDLTTGDRSIHILSREVNESLGHIINNYFEFPDSHTSMRIGNIDIDFSSNFIIPGISYLLRDAGVLDVSDMKKELFSRDFTCNTSLMTMNLKKIIDPTGMAIRDIKRKVIRTCLPPKITLGYQSNRIVRVLYLSAKLNFDVDQNVLNWIKANSSIVKDIKSQYITGKINKALEYNSDRVIDFLNKTDLWQHIPISSDLSYYISRR